MVVLDVVCASSDEHVLGAQSGRMQITASQIHAIAKVVTLTVLIPSNVMGEMKRPGTYMFVTYESIKLLIKSGHCSVWI